MIDNKMTFEEASEKLNAVVRKMEDPKCTLDDSIKYYEQAYELIIYCQKKLDEAKGAITDINEKIAGLKGGSIDNLFED